MNPSSPNRFRRQAGVTAIQISITLAVLAMINLGVARHTIRQAAETRGTVLGGMAKKIKEGYVKYLEINGPKAISGQAVAGVAVALTPTFDELRALGFLDTTIAAVTPIGGTWRVDVEPMPATCTLPGACNLTVTVYPSVPAAMPDDPTRIDGVALDKAMATIGADGGYSGVDDKSNVTGVGWTRANKLGSVAGVLYAIGGYGSATYTALKNIGDACTINGSKATSTGGQDLICRNLVYVSTLNALPSYRVVSKVSVKDGDVVTKPTCEAGGTPAWQLEMNQTAVDITTITPLQSQYGTLTDQGATWQVVIHLKDRNTVDTTANPYGITAILHTQCYYP
jgi:hypothetical protein